MEIDLTLANVEALAILAYWPLVENDDTKPRTKTCPFCGKRTAANAIEIHNTGCLIEAAQYEYEQRLLTAERGQGEILNLCCNPGLNAWPGAE